MRLRRFLSQELLRPVAVALVLLGVAACGGTSPALAPAHLSARCNQADYAMNCVQPATSATPRGAQSIPGVDFGWSALSAGAARADGYRFAASYLSNDPTKNWTPALVNAYHTAGLATVYVWEASANNAQLGLNQGAIDASRALQQANALHHTGTIFFAVDCDCSGPSVAAYFSGATSVLGPRVGAYGGYSTLGYLCAHGLVGQVNWQTYAWSYGRWLPASCAPLEQYLNGNVVDQDRAIAPYYGQDPYNPGPSKAQRARWRRALAASQRVYVAKGCVVFAQRERYFAAHLHGKLATRHQRALTASRRAYAKHGCSVFSGRVAFYERELSAA